MATKTTQKMAQIPDDVKKYVEIVLDALRRALETRDFEISIAYDMVSIKIPDIKAYVYDKFMRIMYKDFDIVYSNYSASIKVYKDPYSEPEVYYAHDYCSQLEEIHKLAKQKVKERLKKVLEKI